MFYLNSAEYWQIFKNICVSDVKNISEQGWFYEILRILKTAKKNFIISLEPDDNIRLWNQT